MTSFTVRGVCATPACREEFVLAEQVRCVADYQEYGPQHFAGDAGFRFYAFADGRELVLAERRGLVTLMTLSELEEESRKLEEERRG